MAEEKPKEEEKPLEGAKEGESQVQGTYWLLQTCCWTTHGGIESVLIS